MSRRGGKTARASERVITVSDLALFRGYSFAWFSEAATLLLVNRTLENLSGGWLQSILPALLQRLDAKIQARLAKAKDKEKASPERVKPLPLVGNDPKNLTLKYARELLEGLKSGQQLGSLCPPSALSLDFAEHTRVCMGRGRAKRDVIRIGEDVLALSIVGAYLTRAYALQVERGRWEFGYVLVNIHSPMLPIAKLDSMQGKVRGVARRVAAGGGGVLPVLVGAAAAIAGTLRGQLREVAKSPLVVEYLRLTQTGNKVMAKGFDTFDVTGLALLLRRGRMAGAVYQLLVNFPERGYNSYRGFAQKLAEGLAKFHMYRKPEYLYDPLRAMCSRELEAEASQLLGRDWQTISGRLQSGLERLAAG